jgi:hypothetical protein
MNYILGNKHSLPIKTSFMNAHKHKQILDADTIVANAINAAR